MPSPALISIHCRIVAKAFLAGWPCMLGYKCFAVITNLLKILTAICTHQGLTVATREGVIKGQHGLNRAEWACHYRLCSLANMVGTFCCKSMQAVQNFLLRVPNYTQGGEHTPLKLCKQERDVYNKYCFNLWRWFFNTSPTYQHNSGPLKNFLDHLKFRDFLKQFEESYDSNRKIKKLTVFRTCAQALWNLQSWSNCSRLAQKPNKFTWKKKQKSSIQVTGIPSCPSWPFSCCSTPLLALAAVQSMKQSI